MSFAARTPVRSFAPTSLLLGNVVVGTSVIAPAGLLNELSSGLNVSIGQASLLVTFGAILMCFGSPLLSWATSRLDRRGLMVGLMLIICVTHIAMALASSFVPVLILRLIMLAAAAPFTPQAAAIAGLLAPPEKRAGTISYVFLGWSLAAAAGLPLMTVIGSRYGWQGAFLAIAVLAGVSGVLAAWRIPTGLKTAPVDLRSWGQLFSDRAVLTLLSITILQMAGQSIVLPFIGPLLANTAGAGPDAIGITFAVYGTMGFLGNLAASQIVNRRGPFLTSLLFCISMAIGLAIWAAGAASLYVALVGTAFWGLGFAASNSMQQARLVAAAPTLAGAAVALNTSSIYVGQAIGSGLGSLMIVHKDYYSMPYVAVLFILLAIAVVLTTRRRPSNRLRPVPSGSGSRAS